MTTAIHLRACASPLGAMTIAARTGSGAPNGGELVGVWFDGQAHDRAGLPDDAAVEPGREGEPVVLAAARAWLERYFAGEDPGAPPPLAPASTAFQQRVREQMLAIPRGSTRTYGQLARRIAALTGRRGSARAVGGAVGRNSISIMVPCHRVVGADGAVVGYAGGTDRKIRLLRLEGADLPGPDLAQDGIPGL